MKMKSDDQIQKEGMAILTKELGLVEAGRFIALTKQDRFDYTKWHTNNPEWQKKMVAELYKEANFNPEEPERVKTAQLKSRTRKPAAKKPAARKRAAKSLVPA